MGGYVSISAAVHASDDWLVFMRVFCIEGVYRLRRRHFLVDTNYLSGVVSAPKLQDEP